MIRSELGFRAVGFGGGASLTLLGWTLRYRIEGAEHFQRLRSEGRPVIFAFWHAGILPLAYLHRNEGAMVLVSRHADGEYITRVLKRLGFRTARGSSTRGGVQGLRELIRAVRNGTDAAITPDGPRGPARKFKAGGLLLAQLTGAPIIPVGLASKQVWRLDSWDGFLVPRPFAALDVRYGEPHYVPRDSTGDELEEHARRLEGILS